MEMGVSVKVILRMASAASISAPEDEKLLSLRKIRQVKAKLACCECYPLRIYQKLLVYLSHSELRKPRQFL